MPLKIGDVAQLLNVSKQTIRNYEDNGTLPTPKRSASGLRLYSAEDVEAIRRALPVDRMRQRNLENLAAIQAKRRAK